MMREEQRDETDDGQTGADRVERGGVAGPVESGTTKQPATRATITIGTFTRKTEPHQKCSSRNPPATGPRAMPRPAMPAQMAMAWARSPAR